MHKRLGFLLILLLCAQFVWGAAAGYCMHERTSSPSGLHFGHHQSFSQLSAADASSSPSTKAALGQLEHSSCHLSHAMLISMAPEVSLFVARQAMAIDPAIYLPFPHPDRIERPNWRAA